MQSICIKEINMAVMEVIAQQNQAEASFSFLTV
jgi:hypothetical protein